jgi:hypothetical protein
VSQYDHLLPELQAFADLPDEERIQLIRIDRWISHPVAELALDIMADLLTYPQRNRMPGFAHPRPNRDGQNDDLEEILP